MVAKAANQGSMLEPLSFLQKFVTNILCMSTYSVSIHKKRGEDPEETESICTSNQSLLKGWMVELDDLVGFFQSW